MVSTDKTKQENTSGAPPCEPLNIVVFSKDRAMQLDLFIRSFNRFVQRASDYSLQVIYTWSNDFFRRGYERLAGKSNPNIRLIRENKFKDDVLQCVDPVHPHTVFFVDDDVFKRPFDFYDEQMELLNQDPELMCRSLRCHPHLTYCHPMQKAITPPVFMEHNVFFWKGQAGDYGYPMSLDGHIFRTKDIRELLVRCDYENPNTLESALAKSPLGAPKMVCYNDSVIVNIPMNRVQTVFDNVHGSIGVEGLNDQFLFGKMLDLEGICGVQNYSCHQGIDVEVVHDPRDNENNRPKVSMIIPVCNIESYLRECLDSAVNQTLREIEIICVEDGSTDSSLSILEEYARRDPRIKLIVHPVNLGTFQTRKDGVLAATGEMILFLDGDDYLELRTCEELFGHARRHGVEILHFGTEVINAGGASESQMDALEKFIRPHPERIEGDEVFKACFLDGKFQFTIWNKLYAAGLCQTAYRQLPDGYILMEEDLYAFFIIAFIARSYVGLADARYYHYRYGSGITGRADMTLDRFTRHCSQAGTLRRIQQWMEFRQVQTKCQAAHDQLCWHLLNGCVGQWLRHLPAADRAAGFDRLVESWGIVDTVAVLVHLGRERRADIARGAKGAHVLTSQKRSVRTIGTYYHRLRNGGVERVLSQLIPLMDGHGIPRGAVHRRAAPCRRLSPAGGRQACRSGHGGRCSHRPLPSPGRAMGATVGGEYKIDVMIYHEWMDSILLPDLLAVKCRGIPFVILAHGVFSFMLTLRHSVFGEMPDVFSLADALVGLSRVDRQYWASFAPRAFYLPNPMTFDMDAIRCSTLESNEIVWVGRISGEKKPLDAIRIMGAVVRRVPAARLLMVGKGHNDQLDAQLAEEIDRRNLRTTWCCAATTRRWADSTNVHRSTCPPPGLKDSRFPWQKPSRMDCPVSCMTFRNWKWSAMVEGSVSLLKEMWRRAAETIVALLENADSERQLGRAARQSMDDFSQIRLEGRLAGSLGRGGVRPTGAGTRRARGADLSDSAANLPCPLSAGRRICPGGFEPARRGASRN